MKTDKLTASRYQRSATRTVIGAFLVLGMAAFVSGQGPSAQNPAADAPLGFYSNSRQESKELALKITTPFTLAAVGDLIEPQPLTSQDPAYLQLINIIRNADVGFANMETSLIDIEHFQGPLAGTIAPLEVGPAIKDMGIKIVNRANNHTLNGGVAGMFSTDAALDQLGIVHAGTGKDLNEARSAHSLETPKGRVGVVGMFSVDDISTYGPNFDATAATYRVGDTGGAPGVNPLRLTVYHIVSPEQLQSLRTIRDAVYGHSDMAAEADKAAGGATNKLKFFDEWYQAGPNPGALSYTMNPNDERDILRSIRNGKLLSDFMVVTIHCHQTTSFTTQFLDGVDHAVPDFLIKLAHESIDNGADIFIGHGVHNLRGVEIYKGKPIFYDLSNFVLLRALEYGGLDDFLAGTRPMSPSIQETVLATSRYEAGQLVEVRIYPVDLGADGRPISDLGIPKTPSPEVARHILEEMQTLSKPFGTIITIENNVGVIRVGASTTGASTGQ